LQLRGRIFGNDAPGIALRPGLMRAIVTENGGVKILQEIGDERIPSKRQGKGQ
jgi:hypothetical protein